MSQISIYLNFAGTTEEAFNFYKSVFKTDFTAPIVRIKDTPQAPKSDIILSEEDLNKIMHVDLPILGGLHLMGTDVLESMGHKLIMGNNISINLQPDTKEEADRLFNELSSEGQIEVPLQIMFWGDYFASFADKYGTRWMINCTLASK